MEKPKQIENVYNARDLQSYIDKKYKLDFDLVDWLESTLELYCESMMVNLDIADVLYTSENQLEKEFFVALEHEFGKEIKVYVL